MDEWTQGLLELVGLQSWMEEIPGCMVTPAKTVRNLSGKIVGGRKNKS